MSPAGGGAAPLRVVQWTTGNVGRRSVRAVVAHPGLELVGCYAWSADKVGRDAGELCGIAPTGVVATNDVGALLALAPDCVVYNPKWPDIDELVGILEAGVNVVTTAAFITGHALGAGRARVLDACERGASSIFGSGMNPGFANLLGIISAGICDRIDSITVTESVDSTGYDSPETELPVGFARPIDDPDLAATTEAGTAVFGDAVRLTADALRIEIDTVRCEAEYAQTTEALDLGSWHIDAGCVAGVAVSWQGIRDGRVVIALNARWRKGQHLEPDWKIEHGYIVDVQGRPCVRTKLEVYPPADFEAKSFGDYMVLGMIMTSLPAVNAIPHVCATKPGIVTYLDLPLVTPQGWVS
jgi:2,4-diaminopentanoate dehydrogenase